MFSSVMPGTHQRAQILNSRATVEINIAYRALANAPDHKALRALYPGQLGGAKRPVSVTLICYW